MKSLSMSGSGKHHENRAIAHRIVGTLYSHLCKAASRLCENKQSDVQRSSVPVKITMFRLPKWLICAPIVPSSRLPIKTGATNSKSKTHSGILRCIVQRCEEGNHSGNTLSLWGSLWLYLLLSQHINLSKYILS